MKHHLIVTYDDKGAPLEIIRLQGRPVIVPYEFDSLGAAETYRQQLFSSLGMEQRGRPRIGGANGKRKRVKNCQTGEIFPSVASAARSILVSPSAVMKYLREPISKNAPRGYTWEYVL